MRTGIDASSAAVEGGSGIAVYIRTLIDAIGRTNSADEFVLCYRASRLANRRYFIKPPGANFSTKIIQEPLNLLFPKSLDVFHGPDARIPKFKRPALVATVHDIFSVVSDKFANTQFREKNLARRNQITLENLFAEIAAGVEIDLLIGSINLNGRQIGAVLDVHTLAEVAAG